MAVANVALTIRAEVLEAAKKEVEAGHAKSLSAFVSDAVELATTLLAFFALSIGSISCGRRPREFESPHQEGQKVMRLVQDSGASIDNIETIDAAVRQGVGEGTVSLEYLGTIPKGHPSPDACDLHPPNPEVVLRSTGVSGDPLEEGIMATLLTRTDEIRRCYERELKQRPRLCGSLGVRFTIAAGHVIQVTQTRWRKNQSSAPLLDCVTRAVRRLKFPKTKGHKDEYTENFQFFDFSAPHPR